MQTLEYWIWLSQLNISARARAAVLKEYHDAEAVFHAPKGSFQKKKGISGLEAELLEQRDLTGVTLIREKCEDQEIRILPYTAEEFPVGLRQIFSPPAVLYIKGNLPQVDEIPVISVIGTRKASPYGIKMGERLAFEISKCGGTVVSLLSSGVDEAAARGAIRSELPCIGVLGTPHEDCRLAVAAEILEIGALISEYPPGREKSRHFFRERNRIAAGLSDGVVVVEAPEKSGTRLFVNEAVEQGKDIFALPGNADAENSVGTLNLLKEGAKLVTCGREVMEEYLSRYPEKIVLEYDEDELRSSPAAEENDSEEKADPEPTETAEKAGKSQANFREQLAQLTEDQLKIVSAIDTSSTHIDDITERTGLSTARVLAQLTVLEIKGFVRREAGRRFALNIIIEK